MLEQLETLFMQYPRWVALTGAGLSAASGIPTYRDDAGIWQRSEPIQHQDFINHSVTRQRYWARSMAGWKYVADAEPNLAHRALVAMEQAKIVPLLVTQNVDRLHQRAGHQQVVDLHGRLDRVSCLDCAASIERAQLQSRLETLNPHYQQALVEIRPDGDAEVADAVVADFQVPECEQCGGLLMPDVVFFGGSVPPERIERISAAIAAADAMLVVGSSLMVFSGFRFAREAVALGKPLVIINRGATRADDLATFKYSADCAAALSHLASKLGKASDSVL